MRLFIALDIDDAIRERITRFVEGVQGLAPNARWVKPESLHVTLKFIGEQSEAVAEQIKQALVRSARRGPKFSFGDMVSFPRRKRREFSGWAWLPARNSHLWPRRWTTRWRPCTFPRKSAPSARI